MPVNVYVSCMLHHAIGAMLCVDTVVIKIKLVNLYLVDGNVILTQRYRRIFKRFFQESYNKFS